MRRRNAPRRNPLKHCAFFAVKSQMRVPRPLPLATGLTVWVGCMVTGFALLQNYASTPGAARVPREDATALVAKFRQPTHGLVVIAVHPLCPCTEASLGELGDLLARSNGQCDAVILEY